MILYFLILFITPFICSNITNVPKTKELKQPKITEYFRQLFPNSLIAQFKKLELSSSSNNNISKNNNK